MGVTSGNKFQTNKYPNKFAANKYPKGGNMQMSGVFQKKRYGLGHQNRDITTHYCEVCKVSCGGSQTYKEHLEEKLHKKKEAMNHDDSVHSLPRLKVSFKCDVCNVTCTGHDTYAKGVKHQKVKCSPLSSINMTLKIVRDISARIPTWASLSTWTTELLAEKALASINIPLSPGDAVRRLFETIAGGVILDKSPTLIDPCEKDTVDLLSQLKNQEREDITASAQHALRLISFNQLYKIPGRPILTQMREYSTQAAVFEERPIDRSTVIGNSMRDILPYLSFLVVLFLGFLQLEARVVSETFKLESRVCKVEQKIDALADKVEQKIDALADKVEQKIDALTVSISDLRVELVKLSVMMENARSLKPNDDEQ